MLAGIFRSNQPVVLLGLFILVPALFGAAFLHAVIFPEMPMPLHAFIGRLVNDNSWVQGGITVFLVLLISAQISLLVNEAELLDRRTHLPALLFPLIYAAFGPSVPLDPGLTGMPLVLLALQRAWSISQNTKVMSALFDSGCLIGLAALFYLPYAFLIVVLWASLSVVRSFQWREYVVPFIGCAAAFYITWGIITLIGSGNWHPLLTMSHTQFDHSTIGTVQASQRIFLGMVLAGMLPVGIISFARSYTRGILRLKNIRSSFLSFTAAIAILVAFEWLLNGSVPPILVAVPITVFCANAIKGDKRSWLSESAVISLLILALWAQWGW
ncbi:MAG: DUF6427 family protein [Bacteroidota bacterium]|nr:DUF6427 family protein [Bacteroidota bacterium]